MELRRRMKRSGEAPNGKPLWTAEELEICRRLYPDRIALAQRLQRRSSEAIRHKCEELGLASVRIAWTAADVTRLLKLYRSATWDELLAAFHGRTETAIRLAATKRGMRRARKPYKLTGYPLLDQVRQRCFEQGLTMRDLDQFARSRGYFGGSAWRRDWYSERLVGRAVRALGGRITAEWIDDPS